MARVQNTLIGKSSGSVGGATFSTWKGINVLKSKAISVANPKTVPQQTQRNRMTIIVAAFRLIAGAIAIGFKTQAVGQSEYNAFVSENIIGGTTVGVAPAVTLTPANMVMSKGTMGSTSATAADGTIGDSETYISWGATIPLGGNANDEAVAIVYNETQDTWGYSATGVLRSAGEVTFDAGSNYVAGNSVHTWLFFKAFDSDEVSDSTYRVGSL